MSGRYLCLCMCWFFHVLALCWWYDSMVSSSVRKASWCFSHFFPSLLLFRVFLLLLLVIFVHIFIYLFICLLIFDSTKPSGSNVTGACRGLAQGAHGWVAGWEGQSGVLVPWVRLQLQTLDPLST